ncbi:MAG: hypothetical protein SGJ27_11430 [Candidatus Melainabacteria bacterium]|nr:hypothetical protein [Candidatus Melainabacteria bacterium]
MTNSKPSSYQLPDVFITDLFVNMPSTQLDKPEFENTDILLAQELLSDLLPTKSSGRIRN